MEIAIADVEKALAALIKRFNALPPVERINLGNTINQGLLNAQRDIAQGRRSAVRELRGSGWTLADIGRETDMTPQRVMQLEKSMDRKEKQRRGGR